MTSDEEIARIAGVPYLHVNQSEGRGAATLMMPHVCFAGFPAGRF